MTEPSTDRNTEQLLLTEWAPVSQARLPRTEVPRAAVPVIDIHNHLGRWLGNGDWETGSSDWVIEDVGALVATMDARNVETIVNLDGMWGDEVSANVERYDRAHPGRFATFCQIDWRRLFEPGGVDEMRRSLDESRDRGARGVKVWKNLGLWLRDDNDRAVLPDDPRVVDVLGHAGDLGLPILIHVADPRAFFEPMDRHNERYDELLEHQGDWWFGDRTRFPAFEEITEGLRQLVLQTPGTQYIGAHVGCDAENLDWVESVMDEAPNFHADTAGRMAELGRQPRRFVRLMEAHPDRILFGTDIYPVTDEQYALHFRFFESDDEHFEYAPDSEVPPQGRWAVSALSTPRRLLEPVYGGNARRLLALSA
jgi:predicted TIM-barrel fold metal-dependent hydrolase